MKLTKEENAELAAVIDLFKPVNPGTVLMFGNKTERKAAQELSKLYKEKVKDFVSFLDIYNGRVKEFYQIRSPHSMLKHIQMLFTVKRKYDAEDNYFKQQRLKEEEEREEVYKLHRIKEETPVDERRKPFNSIMDIIKNAPSI